MNLREGGREGGERKVERNGKEREKMERKK